MNRFPSHPEPRSSPNRRAASAAARLLAAWIILAPVLAVSQTVEWSQRTGTFEDDEAFGVGLDSGGIYLAGSTDGVLPDLETQGKQDAFLRKFDAAGNALWTRQFGSSFDDTAYAVAADSSGVYVAGRVGPEVADFTNDNRRDAFLRRYTAAGQLLWSRQFDSVGTPQNDAALAVAVGGGAVYVAGYTRGTLAGQNPAGGYDAFVRKYDLNGNELWTRQFGSNKTDLAVGIAFSPSGIYVLGNTDGALPGQSYAGGLYDIFLRKYDLNGNELWTRQFGTSGLEFAGGVVAEAGAAYIAGATSGALPGQSNVSGYDAFVRKYDAGGGEIWTRQFGSSGDVLARGITLSGTSLYVAGDVVGVLAAQVSSGGFSEDVFVRKYDLNGNTLWTRQFGTPLRDTAASVAAGAAGIYVAGATPRVLLSPNPNGNWDALLTKLAESAGATPIVHSTGVVNAASLHPQTPPLAAGSLASVHGLHLTAGRSQPVVQLNGIAAPVLAASETLLYFQVPWELAGHSEVVLTITVDGVNSDPVTVPLGEFAPGLFAVNGAGSGQGAIWNGERGVLAAPASLYWGAQPARRGDVVSLYATGLGAVTNPPPTGSGALSLPPSLTLAQPSVRIGGVPAPLIFSGLAPGLPGLYRVDATVPETVAAGDAVAVELSIGGVVSNIVTMAIQ